MPLRQLYASIQKCHRILFSLSNIQASVPWTIWKILNNYKTYYWYSVFHSFCLTSKRLYSNRAACHLKTRNFFKCIEDCSKVGTLYKDYDVINSQRTRAYNSSLVLLHLSLLETADLELFKKCSTETIVLSLNLQTFFRQWIC